MLRKTPVLDRGCLGVFSDELRFSLDNDSRRVLIWREPGSQYQSCNIVEKDHYYRGGLGRHHGMPIFMCSIEVL
ncbi:hypothetical protein TNCV_113911 [Trichonephila clavipes]|nr:hypothetical protein TNCV_113911 [Trichonephila clavipes]